MRVKPPHTQHNYQDILDFMKFKGEQRKFQSFRDKGHYYFDKIWNHKILTRDEAYKWLADKLGVLESDAHFSKLSCQQCEEAVFWCQQLLNDMRRLDLDWGDEPKTPYYELNHNIFGNVELV